MSKWMKAVSRLVVVTLVVSTVGVAQVASEAVTEEWTRGITEQLCEAPNAPTVGEQLQEMLQRLPLPDSTSGAELALRALGGRGKYPLARVSNYTRAPTGLLITFDMGAPAPDTLHRSVTVYVHDGRCVTLLGG